MERAEFNETNLPTKLCELCGAFDNLMLCGGCKEVWYCSRDHQKCHWRKHKIDCKKSREKSQTVANTAADSTSTTDTMPPAGEKRNSSGQNHNGGLNPHQNSNLSHSSQFGTYQVSSMNQGRTAMSELSNLGQPSSASGPSRSEVKIADYVMKCLQDYGICVVDNFMSDDKCGLIKEEVVQLEQGNVMQPGQLVTQLNQTEKKIRGDKITWIEKGDPKCPHISSLIQRLDSLIMACNGRLGKYVINGRTKAMVACYPGSGSYYMRHVDNPNEDGRCVTSIYYLNKDWDVSKDGGLLRIFPSMFNQVADIEPKYDRLLLFWSDRRNPHEVQPAFKTRYAITVWYFDAEERARAKARYKTLGAQDSTLA